MPHTTKQGHRRTLTTVPRRSGHFHSVSPLLTTPAEATKLALKSIARRYQQLNAEIDALDKYLDQLVAAAAPALVAIKGVGTDIGATLLTIAGDNPERLNSEGAFAHLIGVAHPSKRPPERSPDTV